MATSDPGSCRAALREQREAAQLARGRRRVLIAALGIAGILIIAVVGVVLNQLRTNGEVEAAGEQLTPPNASPGYGIYLQAKPPVDGTPHVVVWGDYQCGGCAAYDQMYGPILDQLVTSGDITAEIRQAHFLDRDAQRGPSKRAAMAAAAADEVGHFAAYHRSLYLNQESGYTDQVLRELIPESIGMSGEEVSRFQRLYDSYAFETWVDGADQRFTDSGITSTPSFFVGDQRLVIYNRDSDTVQVEPVADEFLAAVQELFSS